MDSVPRSRTQLFWRLQVGGWLLIIPFFTVVALVVYPSFATACLVGVLRQVVGFGISLALWKTYQRWSAATFKLRPYAWKIVVCCVLATAADMLVAELARRALSIPEPAEVARRGVVFVRFALYVGWSATYFILRQELESQAIELRLARAEAASREAELQLLRAQMNPHFLFNALSTIIGEADHNPAAVIDMTHAVADFLRYSLRLRGHRAPLGDELTAMADYLRVERANYGPARLEWQINVTDEARIAQAPTAFVQPLVENAIKYGIRTSPAPLRLTVSAHVEGGELHVAVENTGRWIERRSGEEKRDSNGIGLDNLRRRLSLLYGDKARFEVFTPPGLVRMEAHLPLTTSLPESS